MGNEQNGLIEEIKKIFDGDLGKTFLQEVDAEKLKIENVQYHDMGEIRKQIETVFAIIAQISDGMLTLSVGDKARQAGLLTSSSAAKTDLYQSIYSVGKKFGVKFKPWQAANIAKKLGNVLKVIGPIISIASAVLDLVEIGKEYANYRKVMEAKRECLNNFAEIAHSLEKQFKEQFDLYKKDFYSDILNRIEQHRTEAVENLQAKTDFEQKLLAYRGQFRDLMTDIFEEPASLANMEGNPR